MSRADAFAGRQGRYYEIGDGSTGLAVANFHYAAAKEAGLRLTYVPKKVTPSEFTSTYRSLCGEADGFVIIPPYKTLLLMLLDAIDADARSIGACNVVVCEGGRFKGYNTDWMAIRRPLSERDLRPHLNRALVIGTGAMARASLYALWRQGFTRMTMAGRNAARTNAVVSGLGFVMGVDARSAPFPGSASSIDLSSYDLVVNATPFGGTAAEDPLGDRRLQAELTVVDLALSPGETPLARRARESGCAVIKGDEVAAAQGRFDVSLWSAGAVMWPERRQPSLRRRVRRAPGRFLKQRS